ncbi:conserved hypothetical protein [Prochlorococcus marinus str. MIT 9515]|uniref:Biotin synthesis protein bioK n=1 Tax=Prochlorococcus marinus (strain MIT 9515) TaxID=167542 RepID=A2BYJ5_PROM5|nr:hypothetical protein [Prochlorococcus marinus]ABM72856.1 conserved hypothetical protein [Prochlorococcus marinus str. MIT 9515]
MKQVITQHGWGLDQSFWDNYKIEFKKNGWHWQDNERGYFSKNVNQSKWITNNLNNQIKMVLCHSLGFHLIQENLLDEASHVVFINSFNNFLPSSKKRNLIYRSLKRMEKKIISFEAEAMLKEFINRSFSPNNVNINFQNMFYKNLESLNNNLLLKDLKKLYTNKDSLKNIEKNCNVIVIISKNDLILDQDSSHKFIELLNKKLTKKPTVIELSNQGHCLTNLNFYQIIERTLDNKYEK